MCSGDSNNMDGRQSVRRRRGAPNNPLLKFIYKIFKRYTTLKIVGLLLSVWTTLSYSKRGAFGSIGGFRDPDTGYIVDPVLDSSTGLVLTNGAERAIVADDWMQMICIGISRITAYFMYPGGWLLQSPHTPQRS